MIILFILHLTIKIYCYDQSGILVTMPVTMEMMDPFLNCNGIQKNCTGMHKPMCCDVNPYDASLCLCCDKIVHSSQSMEKPACCGAHIYDMSKSFCCNGVVRFPVAAANFKNFQCCGINLFDKTKLFCCKDLVRSNDALFIKPQCCGETLFDSYSNRFMCCNSTIYQNIDIMCCNENIQYTASIESPICCGKEVIDSSIYTCNLKK
jgi:hypothetical protein